MNKRIDKSTVTQSTKKTRYFRISFKCLFIMRARVSSFTFEVSADAFFCLFLAFLWSLDVKGEHFCKPWCWNFSCDSDEKKRRRVVANNLCLPFCKRINARSDERMEKPHLWPVDSALCVYDLPGLPWEVSAKRPYISDPLAKIAVLLPNNNYYYFKSENLLTQM